MGLKADPPDFIDSGSYNVTDVRSWGGKAVGVALGTALIGSAVLVGIGGAQTLEREFSQRTGMSTQNQQGSQNTIEVV